MTEQDNAVFDHGTTPRKPKSKLKRIFDSFSYNQIFIFTILVIFLLVSAISILGKVNKGLMVEIPDTGGTLTEGIFGSPRFVNPIIAASDTDRDVAALVYSGLMRKTPEGEIVPDMAEGFAVSEGGLTYTFKLKAGAMFHDRAPLTADDVIFTIERIKDSEIKSPLEAVWDGVSVSKGDDQQTVIFRLSRGYASFLENTTVGILPKHIWERLSPGEFSFSDQNITAVGSGPYRIADIKERGGGLIEEYRLRAWNNYVGKKPYIKNIDLIFYKNEDELIKAYRKGRIDQVSSISPKAAEGLEKEGYIPTTAVLSRVFGLFLNPNQNEMLRNKDVVRAIDLILDKEKIVDEVLHGFGTVIESPVPITLGGATAAPKDVEGSKAEAAALLDKAGYPLNQATGLREKAGKPLQFSISTADVAELRGASEMIKTDLAAMGITVSIKVFDVGMLNQNVIRPREYEALFFGQVVRNVSDLFAFWHSSQRNDPGLNVSVYTNTRVDKILEDLIAVTDSASIPGKIAEFENEIKNDIPAVLIYSPHFVYMQSGNVQNVGLARITNSSERFLDVSNWYIRTDYVYEFLLKKEEGLIETITSEAD